MFCANCGKEISDGIGFCPQCGTKISARTIRSEAKIANGGGNNRMVGDPRSTTELPGTNGNKYLVDADRSLVKYILLTIVTCGIYSLYFYYRLIIDVNIICEGDGKQTPGLLQYILLGIITCGIYALFWEYSLGNRLSENAPRYGFRFSENGTTLLMWQLFGVLLCGIGPLIALNIIINNTNTLARAYNSN